ncbi:MAG: anaerobic glycerol-3-phosphate dehydrogenase subunit C [Planctomycetota bacterium]
MSPENICRDIASDLTKTVKGDVFADIFTRAAFSTDASIYQIIPLCVAAPRDSEDIAAIIRYAGQKNIPIAARGAGSGLAGEALTSGIVLDMTRYMNKIIAIDDAAKAVTCQAGVVLDDLNACLEKFGKKIGPDPSSSNRAVVGGVVANNATGAHCLQYGYIANHVEEIEAVLADGSVRVFCNNVLPDPGNAVALKCYDLLSGNRDVIQNALPRTRRNRCGYNIAGVCHDGTIDMAKLLTGSEGTLAVFTQITLRTVDIPAYKAVLQLEFDSLENMGRAVPAIVDSGASACELMDKRLINMAIHAFPQYRDILPADAAAVLLVEHTAEMPDQLREKMEQTDAAVAGLASNRFVVFDEEQQKRLWAARNEAVPLLTGEKSDKQPIPFIEDVSVENTKLDKYLLGIEGICRKYNTPAAYYGHAGDGEVHIRPYLDLSCAEDVEKMRKMADEVFALAWSLGGSISGEHADGLVRAAFIKKQYGPEFYQLLREVKNIFDPFGLMNPGKIINDDADIMVKNLRAGHAAVSERLKTNLIFGADRFRLEVNQCGGDGLCRSKIAGARMCPVFRALGEELACSRAKANILRFWLTGIIDEDNFESKEFKEILDLCINCKMCSVECPSGVDISRLIIEARAEFARRKGFSITELVLSHNRILSIAGATFAPLSNFVMSLPAFRWFLEKAAGIDRRRALPAFKRGSGIKKARRYIASLPAIENPIDKVVYFLDSYANYNDHQLALAVVKTLCYNNIEVAIPSQIPTPVPALMYGNVKAARRDLRYIIKNLVPLVNSGYKVICSEPSAALFLRHEAELLADDCDTRLVSDNSFELTGYLRRLLDEGKLRKAEHAVEQAYAYHMPCHLCALGEKGAGIEVLRKLCSVSITDAGAGCCGLAGTAGMKKQTYDLSIKIGSEMAEAINAINAECVLTECSACRMQIEQLTGRKAEHPIKVLACGYGLL